MHDLPIDIDSAGYQLLSILEVNENAAHSKQKEPKKQLHGIPKLADLGEVKEMTVSSQDSWGQIDSKYLLKGGKQVGFGKINYKQIKSIASAFLEPTERNRFADEMFIEDQIFKWVLSIYNSNISSSNLTSYLEGQIDKYAQPFTFYFRISPVGIECPIDFGGVLILPFTAQMVKAEFDKLRDKTRDWNKYLLSFESMIGNIVVEVAVSAVESKAETLARNKAALAVNALKCLLSLESVSSSYQIFDLDFSSIRTGFSHSVIKYNDEGGVRLHIKRLNGILPIELTAEVVGRLEKDGMRLIHDFLISENHNAFQILIVQAIGHFGTAMSERQLHERVVQITSFFELFLNDEKNSRSKAETYLKNSVLPMLLRQDDVELGKILIRKLYNIRDKYLHNRITSPIDPEELLKIQMIALGFLKYCIKVSCEIKTKEELFLMLNIPF